MKSIADLVDDLSANPRPVLCLDTCDLMDVVRGFLVNDLSQSRSCSRLVNALNLNPEKLELVITFLVKHEWEENFVMVRSDAEKKVQEVIRTFASVADVRSHVALSSFNMPDLDGLGIIDRLRGYPGKSIRRKLLPDQETSSIRRRRSMPRCVRPTLPTSPMPNGPSSSP